MSWLGRWRNQYGSTIEITSDEGGRVEGTFRTALEESGFYGRTVPIFGAAHGDVIGFTSAADTAAGSAAVSYTGLLRDGRLEMLWHMVSGSAITGSEGQPAHRQEIGTWRAFTTSLDIFHLDAE